MATTNLNLATISTSDLLSNFPSAFNGNMGILDNSLLTRSITSAQLDSVNRSGFYLVTDSAALVIHIQWDENYAMQIANNVGDQRKKTRFKISGTWGAWHYDGGDLLWTNPSPTESFEAQTIATSSLAQPLSNFKFVRVHALMKTDYGREVSSTTRINVASSLQGYSSFGNQFFIRDYNVGTSGIDFANCYQVMTGGGTNNSSLIPVNIYGIV